NVDARDRISRILSERLGQGATFRVGVTYDEAFDPLAALPTPQECVANLNAVLAQQKITFAPGSAEVDGVARQVVDALAEVLTDCPQLEMEISGHTDSQGSEAGNRALSQARAEAVLSALQGRRLPVQAFVARGYGEDRPIANNATEEGREANRRIEFTLLREPEPAPAPSPVAEAEAAVAARQAGAGNAASEGAAATAAEAEAEAESADSDGTTLTIAAANAPDPVNGAVRSITIPAAAGVAEENLVFEAVEETFPRPPRRP
ncbi:MAG: OmpA family protein, partial [Pseudorhodobacter sp.]